jgi:uncharacterized lipoprotein YajG
MKRTNVLKKTVFLALALSVLLFGCGPARQTVRFETVPDKADLYVDGVLRGKTPVTVSLVTDAFLKRS